MTTATRRPARNTGPKLTPEQARTFHTYSVGNAASLAMALTCDCVPYQDTYTFGRWIAQGYAVRKGEHGHHISVKHETEKRDKETGEVTTGERWGTAVVFCRCQVAPLTPKAGTAS